MNAEQLTKLSDDYHQVGKYIKARWTELKDYDDDNDKYFEGWEVAQHDRNKMSIIFGRENEDGLYVEWFDLSDFVDPV